MCDGNLSPLKQFPVGMSLCGKNARKTCSDGLGRMTTVWEDPAGLNYETDYTYDTLGNLKSVNQKGNDPNSANWRPRSFAYDSLSRLTSASNPEYGNSSSSNQSILYTYSNDSSGCSRDPYTMCTKQAPTPNAVSGTTKVTTTYTYDRLDRLYKKTYSDGTTPTVSFGYDADTSTLTCSNQPTLTDSYPKSARTAMCDGSGATSWAHDQMGRVITESRMISGSTAITKSIVYGYNSDGSLAALTYPSGRTITYTPNGSGGYTGGRSVSAVDSANAINYVTNATYAPHGALATIIASGTTIKGIETYNVRLQPWEIYYTKNTAASYSALQQTTCPTLPSGQVASIMHRAYDFHLATDNGNVSTIYNCLATDRTQNFDYDNLNRIVDAYTTGTSTAQTNWGATYSIDAWGNMHNVGPYTGRANFPPPLTAAVTTANQFTGFGYDIAGNLVTNGPTSYIYDAENRIVSTSGRSYRYDGNGERVVKCTGSYPTCSSATLYWKGTGSDPLAEANWIGTISFEYTFFNGTRLARRNGTGNSPYYYFADHLGSADVITGAAGVVQKESDYQPYGNEIQVTGPSFANNYKFTGKERDTESGLDNFGARYDASSLGRFMTPDWAAGPNPVPYASLGDPQTLNLYGYVQNNPLRRTDPTGHDPCTVDGEKHDSLWCWGHRHGFVETKKETAAREAQEKKDAEEVMRALTPDKLFFLSSAAAWQVGVNGGFAQVQMGAGALEAEAGALSNANYAQTYYDEAFQKGGLFEGKTVSELASDLRSGALKPSDVPIEYIVKDGNTLMLNTRSAQALEQAGIPRSQWNAVNVTGDPGAEARLAAQLQRNNLTSAGTPTVQPNPNK